MSVVLQEYSINVNSSKRDVLLNKSPLNFTTWLNDIKDKSNICRAFKNVKYISIDHITFPNFIQLVKHIMPTNDSLYDVIDQVMDDLTSVINEQYDVDGITFEICNKYSKNGTTNINFTINENRTTLYEYEKSSTGFIIYVYSPVRITDVPNPVQFISIQPFDNSAIYNTNGHNIFKYVLPKLKKDTELYSYLRKNKTTFRDCNLQNLIKMQVALLDNNSEHIKVNNLDYDYSISTKYSLNEPRDYSSPEYYLRHPLNPRYQVDVFLCIGCYEKEMKLSVFEP